MLSLKDFVPLDGPGKSGVARYGKCHVISFVILFTIDSDN